MTTRRDELEQFRAYLGVLRRTELHARHKGKIDESGVVQQTMEDAVRARDKWRSLEDEPQKRAWLKLVFLRNLIDAIRRIRGHHVPLPCASDGSSARAPELVAGGDSPSEHAKRNEEWRLFIAYLPELPKGQRTALTLRYLEGLELAQVATRMNLTKGAVAQLIHNGIKGLRAHVADGDEARDDD